jgi:ScaI restriction endonuclease
VAALSPYDGVAVEAWPGITRALLRDYPVAPAEIVEIVQEQWASIFMSRVGKHGLRIGEHIFPKPQIMGDYLHELIPYEFRARYPDVWRRDESGMDKDLVYVPSPDSWSTEIKTSSHPSQIFGNRSYAQPSAALRKSKSGFYLTVNFEKWAEAKGRLPQLRLIRLGWLDRTDWIAQRAATGQQARIRPEAYLGKLAVLFSLSKRQLHQ